MIKRLEYKETSANSVGIPSHELVEKINEIVDVVNNLMVDEIEESVGRES